MKITLKDFLAEQAKKGIKVPQIFENLESNDIINPTDEQDFENWDDTDISGPSMDNSIRMLIDDTIDLIKKEVALKYPGGNPKVESQMAKLIAELWTNRINDDLVNLNKFNTAELTEEGFFNNIKNALSGTIEYQTSNNYAGSPEAQAFVAKDKRAQIQIETLSKKGMTPEEAKSAVMYVFDKNSKNPLGFVGKAVTFDPATKTLRVGNAPGLGAINNK